ncbi:MAG: hypothetical protein VR64_11560 [Desulfatitalea sp. BRH_c12]|nr:MAG: hypothetical protein VR64_11560 [Desulfatitalea sp. BRH_c12]
MHPHDIRAALTSQRALVAVGVTLLALLTANVHGLAAIPMLALLLGACFLNPLLGIGMGACLGAGSEHLMIYGFEKIGTLSRVVTVSALLGFLFNPYARNPDTAIRPLVLPLLFLALCLASVAYSKMIRPSVIASVTIGINVLTYCLIVNLREEKKPEACTYLLYIALTLSLYLSLRTYYLGIVFNENFLFEWADRISIDRRTNPNQLGIGLCQLMPCVLFLLFKKNQNAVIRLICIIAVLHILGALFLIKSRNAILCSFITLLVCTVVYLKGQGAFSSTRALFSLIGLIAGCGLLMLILTTQFFNLNWTNRFQKDHFGSRLTIAHRIWTEVIQHNVLFGVGISGSNEQAEAQGSMGFLRMANKPSHNMFLSVWAQLGLVGLVLYLVLLGRSLAKGFSVSRKNPLAAPFWICLMSSILLGMGETLFLNKLLWLSMAFCTSLSLHSDARRTPVETPLRMARPY